MTASIILVSFHTYSNGWNYCILFFGIQYNYIFIFGCSSDDGADVGAFMHIPLQRKVVEVLINNVTVREKTLHEREISVLTSEFTCLTIVCSCVFSGSHQRKYQSSASLVPLWGESTGHRYRPLVDSPDKGPVMRRVYLFHGVIMTNCSNELYFTHVYRRFLARRFSLKREEICQPLW